MPGMRNCAKGACMNKDEFGKGYADQYDLLYSDKDYEDECNFLEEVLEKYRDSSIASILDLGCGTGNHALPLGARGYKVTGVDLSSDMLVHAKEKAQKYLESGSEQVVNFLQGDIRDIDLKQTFDTVLMMFSVLGLQTTNADVFSALCTARKHLKPGGIFVCDVWYGPAVLKIRPSDRIKVIQTKDGQVIRSASGTLNTISHLTNVNFHIWQIEQSQLLNEVDEVQITRFFFPQELAFFMEQAKLELITMCAIGNLNQQPTEETWNIVVVGKAV